MAALGGARHHRPVQALPFRALGAAVRFAWLLLFLWVLPASAQFPRLASSAPQPATAEARDPLDRGTPRRSVAGFIRAAHRESATAVLFLQGGQRPQARAERLVRDLSTLMDRHFHQPLGTISDSPDGAVDDGLPLDRERIGPLRVAGEDHYIELVRVEHPDAGKIWLISGETLARVPELRDSVEAGWLERRLPQGFFAEAAFGFTYADLALWAISLLLPLLLLPPLFSGLHILARRLLRTPERIEAVDAWYRTTRWPGILILTLALHGWALDWYGPTLPFRIAYSRLLVLLLVVVLGWTLHRVLSFAFRRVGARLQDQGRGGSRSVMMLGERLVNVVLLLLVVLAMLAVAGFDVKTVLAGLGIVGVALALGAQKTIENILGGVMLLGDEAFAVGDLCRINNRLGTVEDITLRSVRFRTIEQTLLSIPAGVLAQAEIENFATRGKILALHRLRLAHDTSVDQLRRIVAEMEMALANRKELERPGARIRLVEFAPLGIELELYAYVLTSDMQTFLTIREDLLLQLAAIVEGADARFAEPVPVALPPPVVVPTR